MTFEYSLSCQVPPGGLCPVFLAMKYCFICAQKKKKNIIFKKLHEVKTQFIIFLHQYENFNALMLNIVQGASIY